MGLSMDAVALVSINIMGGSSPIWRVVSSSLFDGRMRSSPSVFLEARHWDESDPWFLESCYLNPFYV